MVENLVSELLPTVATASVELETARRRAIRIDGRIIGTGEADFTKGNVTYTLNFQDKTFQLVDVPGIEGDEKRFTSMVQEAIARAHLVFYVNGTNKKPEKATAEKIRSYLHRGSHVCPLLNVRGNADAYEFEEDRDSLEAHGGSNTALEQTMGVLRASLGDEILMEGHCIQGLLAFSALAIDRKSRRTTIHPSRDRDLFIQQRNYLKYFRSPSAMLSFSQIESVANILRGKLGTFKEDIIEANKTKVRELLAENIVVLETAQRDHELFMQKVRPEFKKCHETITGALQTFERLVPAGRKNIGNQFFNEFADEADEIVDRHLGEEKTIQSEFQREFRSRRDALKPELQEQFQKEATNLQEMVTKALERLVKDVSRVRFETDLETSAVQFAYSASDLDMGLSLSDFGGILAKVGSFALVGAGLGSAIPVVGNVAGAIAGALIGLGAWAWGHVRGRAYRVRKAQGKLREVIDTQRQKFLAGLERENEALLTPARESIDQVRAQIDGVQAQLARPLEVVDRQIDMMKNLKNQLEAMPYGSIRAIQ
ncbi:MAG: hypothetical protein P8011_15870 [Acidihalobacter sp.]|uniref:hypothetical protein n=1 Tax=Acidihalobacter sp. TaxID=1872108 RepID=UPI00307D516F